MRQVRDLSRKLRELLQLVEDEAEINPDFARRLTHLLGEKIRRSTGDATKAASGGAIPDVFEALERLGEEEFHFWLRGLDLSILKSIVRVNGYDPQERVRRWKDPDKFVILIVEQTKARRSRGSAFLNPKES